jgi:hypothetical protein
MRRLTIALAFCLVASAAVAGKKEREVDVTRLPGFFDFGNIEEFANGEESVEINLTQPLLGLAEAVIVKEDPDMANLVADLSLVKVNAFGVNADKRSALEDNVDKLSRSLTSEGWQQLVKVRDKKERVFLYVKPDTEQRGDEERDLVVGVAALVIGNDKDRIEELDHEAVFVNIVGKFDIEAIVKLVRHFNVPHLEGLGGVEESGRESSSTDGSEESH